MSRDRRRWEEPALPYREPYGRPYSDEYSWRHDAPPTSTELLPRRHFDYWRDDTPAQASYYPQRSHRRERHNEQWRDDSRPQYAELSYHRSSRSSGPARDWDNRGPRRDRSPHGNSARQRYSTHTPPPYIPRPTFQSPVEPSPPPRLPPPSRPRRASPPPTKSSQLPKPGSRYLSLSQEPSNVLQDPGTSRKLLVLDLNGTLLFRSPRSRTASARRMRSVQPRPYMQSFRQYLFFPETKAWLDTMVWSSAQPHSVDDMIDKVFGATKSELKVVWNRQNLGLSEREYHQDTVTVKDLTKPWDLFSSALSHEKSHERPVAPSQSQTLHSAFMTLLVDDSPHKAALQPYNHVCIPEYDNTRRQHDLRSFLSAKEPKKNKKAKQKDQVEEAAQPTNNATPELSPGDVSSECSEKEPYDATLLAVVGILDAVRLQSNIASWIRKGGLWAMEERSGRFSALEAQHPSAVNAEDGKAASNTVVPTSNDAGSISNPSATPLQTNMWFNDTSVMAYWAARGRKTLMDLGIQIIHGVSG